MRTIATAVWDALRDFGAMTAIVLLCVGAAIVYGVCHDQITARICIEYFSVFHSTDVLPPGMDPNSPTQQGFFWGVFATWWMGLFIGVPLSIVARIGTAKPVSARDLVRPVAFLLVTMAVFAFVAGVIGYFLSPDGSATRHSFPAFASRIPPPHWRGFMADYFAHNASYLVGGAGGFVLLIHTAFVRWRKPKRR
ncbi:MAG: hypothetical protein H8F28_02295 [Fibrella sp.]|nr:hypothetical protein [Armatimonadota bacterium]